MLAHGRGRSRPPGAAWHARVKGSTAFGSTLPFGAMQHANLGRTIITRLEACAVMSFSDRLVPRMVLAAVRSEREIGRVVIGFQNPVAPSRPQITKAFALRV